MSLTSSRNTTTTIIHLEVPTSENDTTHRVVADKTSLLYTHLTTVWHVALAVMSIHSRSKANKDRVHLCST